MESRPELRDLARRTDSVLTPSQNAMEESRQGNHVLLVESQARDLVHTHADSRATQAWKRVVWVHDHARLEQNRRRIIGREPLGSVHPNLMGGHRSRRARRRACVRTRERKAIDPDTRHGLSTTRWPV